MMTSNPQLTEGPRKKQLTNKLFAGAQINYLFIGDGHKFVKEQDDVLHPVSEVPEMRIVHHLRVHGIVHGHGPSIAFLLPEFLQHTGAGAAGPFA